MQINLEENEINAILAILGDMPSKSGTWPLMMKIKVQADAQLVEPEDEPEEEGEEETEEVVNGCDSVSDAPAAVSIFDGVGHPDRVC